MTQERHDLLGVPIVESGTAWQGQIEKRLHAVEQGLREFRELNQMREQNQLLQDKVERLEIALKDAGAKQVEMYQRAIAAEYGLDDLKERVREKLSADFLDSL